MKFNGLGFDTWSQATTEPFIGIEDMPLELEGNNLELGMVDEKLQAELKARQDEEAPQERKKLLPGSSQIGKISLQPDKNLDWADES